MVYVLFVTELSHNVFVIYMQYSLKHIEIHYLKEVARIGYDYVRNALIRVNNGEIRQLILIANGSGTVIGSGLSGLFSKIDNFKVAHYFGEFYRIYNMCTYVLS